MASLPRVASTAHWFICRLPLALTRKSMGCTTRGSGYRYRRCAYRHLQRPLHLAF